MQKLTTLERFIMVHDTTDTLSDASTAFSTNTKRRRTGENGSDASNEKNSASRRPEFSSQCFSSPLMENPSLQDLEAYWLAEIGSSWFSTLKNSLLQKSMIECLHRVARERRTTQIYPPDHLMFRAFRETPFDNVKVVILGQDPYHGPGQAMGLAFSVPDTIPPPPSLVNIYKEVQQDFSQKPPHGNLTAWSKEGVLLLNTILTVEKGKPMSHAKTMGWETFTDCVLRAINERPTPVVFLLWGNAAQKKGKQFITNVHHHILTAGHPSPLSVRFFKGCQHFNKANAYLTSVGIKPVQWLCPWVLPASGQPSSAVSSSAPYIQLTLNTTTVADES